MRRFLFNRILPFFCGCIVLASCSGDSPSPYPQIYNGVIVLHIEDGDGRNVKRNFPFPFGENIAWEVAKGCKAEMKIQSNSSEKAHTWIVAKWREVIPETESSPKLVLQYSFPNVLTKNNKEIVEITLRNPTEWGEGTQFHLKLHYDLNNVNHRNPSHPDYLKPDLIRCEVNGKEVDNWLRREGTPSQPVWKYGDGKTPNADLTLRLPQKIST